MAKKPKLTMGWREWIALPQLGVPAVKAKIDTGARTSAIHADNVRVFENNGVQRVRFDVHPLQRDQSVRIACEAVVVDRRRITDSGGHSEVRYVIETTMSAGGQIWPIKLSLASRDSMRFRMLLARTAMAGRMLVDPGGSFVLGRPLSNTYENKGAPGDPAG